MLRSWQHNKTYLKTKPCLAIRRKLQQLLKSQFRYFSRHRAMLLWRHYYNLTRKVWIGSYTLSHLFTGPIFRLRTICKIEIFIKRNSLHEFRLKPEYDRERKGVGTQFRLLSNELSNVTNTMKFYHSIREMLYWRNINR